MEDVTLDGANNMDATCTFCAEFSANPSGEFLERYGELLATRLVYDDGNFRSFPTIGQIQFGHLLLAPIQHFENFSQAIVGREQSFSNAYAEIRSRVSALGHVLAFEHGAHRQSGGACGIYHAHIHLVPFPRPVSAGDLGLMVKANYSDLNCALRSVQGSEEYIVGQDSTGETWVLDGNSFGSQFLRKRIVEKLSLDVPSDWRLAAKIEPQMLGAVQAISGLFAVSQKAGVNYDRVV